MTPTRKATLKNPNLIRVKTDCIVFLTGTNPFSVTIRKKDKKIKTKKSNKGKKILLVRISLQYRKNHKEKSGIQMANVLRNAADMYRRETITILWKNIDDICESEDEKGNKFEYVD